MKSKSIITTAVAILALAVASLAVAGPGPGPKLDKQDISAHACDGKGTKQLVDVHYTILNDADSAVGGTYWANDTIDRHVRIWQEADSTFCVQVEDHGKFVTYAGPSPQNTGTVPAGVKGDIEGGYITDNVVGTFAPSRATHGNLGTFDLACDPSGNCPGTTASWKDYFAPGFTADEFAQWGWLYKAGHDGTWLNQDSGNAGDVT